MMSAALKQASKFCRRCQRDTLHIAQAKKQEMGCGFIVGNLFLCFITLGLWIPVFMLLLGLGVFGNAVSPLAAKYHCQACGTQN